MSKSQAIREFHLSNEDAWQMAPADVARELNSKGVRNANVSQWRHSVGGEAKWRKKQGLAGNSRPTVASQAAAESNGHAAMPVEAEVLAVKSLVEACGGDYSRARGLLGIHEMFTQPAEAIEEA